MQVQHESGKVLSVIPEQTGSHIYIRGHISKNGLLETRVCDVRPSISDGRLKAEGEQHVFSEHAIIGIAYTYGVVVIVDFVEE